MFSESLKQGKYGEYVIKDFLNRQKWVKQVVDVSDDLRHQEKDIDFLVENLERQFYSVEIKTDYQAHETGNLAYELTTSGHIGCLEKTEADWIIFFIPNGNIAYLTITSRLKDYVKNSNFEERTMGDRSTGYLLPIEDLKRRKIIHTTFKEVM